MKRYSRGRGHRQGFTLMEMLIVLGILVMVFALAAPRFFGARAEADKKTAKTQIHLFEGALEKYELDTGSFPATEQGLVSLVEETVDTESEEETVSNWKGPYINKSEIPKDPWGNEFQYAFPPERGEGKFPEIWSMGPDGEDDTDDDICSWTRTSEEGDEFGEGDDPLDSDLDLGSGSGGTEEF